MSLPTEPVPGIELFAVRNQEGKYFHRKGYGGYGETWTSDFKKARIYTKIGQARAIVTFFADRWPEYGIPDVVQLMVTEVKVIKEEERVKTRQKKAADRERQYKIAMARQKLAHAEADLVTAQSLPVRRRVEMKYRAMADIEAAKAALSELGETVAA